MALRHFVAENSLKQKVLSGKMSKSSTILQVLVNIGGGYSATSGVFRVPVSGLYLITCSFSVNAKNNKARAYLKRNNHEIGRMKLECDVSRWCRDHGTLTQPMSLTNGDAIYVECEKSLEGDDLCTFSGVLLK